MGNPALERLKKAQEKKPLLFTKTVAVASSSGVRPPLKASVAPPQHRASPTPRKPKQVNGHVPLPVKSASDPRPPIRERPDPIKHIRPQKRRTASPAVMTPNFTSSGDESENEELQSKKRRRTNRRGSVDTSRRIRDLESFDEEKDQTFTMVHAADIANLDITEHNRTKYETYFTALEGDEEDEPTIQLQYPSASQRERYLLVKPKEAGDFKPLTEIMENMKCVAEHYLSESDARKVFDESDIGSGLVAQLDHAAKRGTRAKIGAQTEFIEVVTRYNAMLSDLRKSGTIAKNLDEMQFVPLSLVEHIIKSQVYARTVSPQVHLVRQYASFSDNVYGELLPKFLSEIFTQTHLKSDQIFVDLGSGVGNCVLQAALEIGCESWGCEMMENPSKLAQLQAAEFTSRCRMWGIKPGKVRLIRDDFLANAEINAILPRADVILINNQAFTSDLNDVLKIKFLDLKEGCQIVSLKPFRDPEHRIKDMNENDPVNILTVEKKERFSGHVSWTDDPGSWYLQRKDSRALKAFTGGRRPR